MQCDHGLWLDDDDFVDDDDDIDDEYDGKDSDDDDGGEDEFGSRNWQFSLSQEMKRSASCGKSRSWKSFALQVC